MPIQAPTDGTIAPLLGAMDTLPPSEKGLYQRVAHSGQSKSSKRRDLKPRTVLTPKFGFPDRAALLAPTKDFFNTLANPRTVRMFRTVCVSTPYGRTPVDISLDLMRNRVELAKFSFVPSGVVNITRSYGGQIHTRANGNPLNYTIAFGLTADIGEPCNESNPKTLTLYQSSSRME
jgi:hypothetical protein